MKNDNQSFQQYISDHDVIYALRTAHQNQTQLVVLADQKANILISVVAIVFTILLTNADFLSSINDWFLLSFISFLLLEVVAIFAAFLVLLPKNIQRRNGVKLEEVSNPLFFGAYTDYEQDEYVDYLLNKMHDNPSARVCLLKDFYQTGVVLKRKYMLLKYAYGFAVAGFVMLLSSVGIFLIIN